jgi:hypothetical protein
MHPLYGKSFTLVYFSSQKEGQGYAVVSYREGMNLSIPLDVTQLHPVGPSAIKTKLTRESVTELVTLAEKYEVICPSHREKSVPD